MNASLKLEFYITITNEKVDAALQSSIDPYIILPILLLILILLLYDYAACLWYTCSGISAAQLCDSIYRLDNARLFTFFFDCCSHGSQAPFPTFILAGWFCPRICGNIDLASLKPSVFTFPSSNSLMSSSKQSSNGLLCYKKFSFAWKCDQKHDKFSEMHTQRLLFSQFLR